MQMKRFWQFIILAAFAAPWAPASMVVTYGSSSVHVHQDDNGKSVVTLDPDPFEPGGGVFLRSDPSAGFIDAMTKSKAAADWKDKLKFTYDGDLNGTMRIDVYAAKHTADLTGGAEFLLHYNRGAGDPAAADLFWIQTVDSSTRNGGETAAYPDVYFSNYPAGSKQPFYFRPEETNLDANPYVGAKPIRSGDFTVKDIKYDYDIAFWDFPQRTADAWWRGELFLASYDKAGGNVKIYDGVYWGFDIVKTPEPSTLMLAAIGVMLVVLGRLRTGQRSTCSELTTSPRESLRLM